MSGERPMPADFGDHLTKTIAQQMEIFGAGKGAIARWRRECGIKVNQRGWSDADLETIRQGMIAGLNAAQIAESMGNGRGRKGVLNAAKHYALGEWASNKGGRPTDTIPDDFAEKWATMTIRDLMVVYSRSFNTITKWTRKLNLKRPRRAVAKPQTVSFIRQAPSEKRRFVKDRYANAPTNTHQRDMSAAGIAADVLRRDRWAVYRCNEAGHQSIGGKFWRCGRVVVTDAELIERAARIERKLAA